MQISGRHGTEGRNSLADTHLRAAGIKNTKWTAKWVTFRIWGISPGLYFLFNNLSFSIDLILWGQSKNNRGG
ncbi:hypothetical protein N752_09700 [Desulforamulus aquiferis]|nr:hypothetical protein N752_09700 [Desulforamulus aquiferis]